MDVILHIGAHRTASTSFQAYMRCNAQELARQGTGFWGPKRTRGGVLSGVIPVLSPVPPKRQLKLARGRILTQIGMVEARGFSRLIVSDENMIGTPRQNLRKSALYGAIGPRLAQFHHAFDGRITRIALSIRSLESYWASLLNYAVKRGHSMPSAQLLEQIVAETRSWRDVITDVACAMPDVELLVMPFEIYAGQPEAKLRLMTNGGQGTLARGTGAVKAPLKHHRKWLNRGPDMAQLAQILLERGAPLPDFANPNARDDAFQDAPLEGRWQPFTRAQIAQLREKYYDDLYWLRAGADGLATLTEETSPHKTRINLAGGQTIEGQKDDIEEGRVA